LPNRRHIDGIDQIEYLVIDDGSTDGTAEAARNARCTTLSDARHLGLAAGFMAGVDASLKHGADVIVTTDADNQYNAEDMLNLIDPIKVGHTWSLATGSRKQPEFFSNQTLLAKAEAGLFLKQVFLLRMLRVGSGLLSREAAMRTMVLSYYSYTLETLIQAGR
jgi:glycosyltransferase involved in cell wall biosynthesis